MQMYMIKKMFPYLLLCELAFLTITLFGADTGGLMFMLFITIPVICFTVSFIYGHGVFSEFRLIQLMFPLFVGCLFALTFYVVFQEMIWIYPTAYAAISLFGNAVGCIIKKNNEHSE